MIELKAVDLKAVEMQVQQAREARMDAQAAGYEVEALIAAVQHFEPGKQRLVFMVDVGEPEPFGTAS
jgi:hypothetical protein